jgi:valyl-tRNA synthetase
MSQLKAIAVLASLDPYALRLEEGMDERPLNQVSLVVSGIEIYLPVSELVDVEAERGRLLKELGEIETQMARLESLLSSPFAQKAPPAVVDKERQKLATYRDTALKLKEQLAGLT